MTMCQFATKPELAQRMLQRLLDAGVEWFTADGPYGDNPGPRAWCETGRAQTDSDSARVDDQRWGPRTLTADRVITISILSAVSSGQLELSSPWFGLAVWVYSLSASQYRR